MDNAQELIQRLNHSGKKLSKSHRRIAECIVSHYDKAAFMTASKLGESVGVSESTVVRFASAMGYEGYPQLQRSLQELVSHRLTARVAIKMVFDLKKTIFSAIERLSLSFFTGRQTGGLMTQINEDANTIYSFFCDGVPYMLINIVQVAVLAVLLFTMQPLLALVSLITVPAFLFFIKWMYRRQRLYHARRFAGSKQMNSFLADVFSGMRVVKAFSREQVEVERFAGRNENLAESEKKLAIFNGFTRPLASFVLAIGNLIAGIRYKNRDCKNDPVNRNWS